MTCSAVAGNGGHLIGYDDVRPTTWDNAVPSVLVVDSVVAFATAQLIVATTARYEVVALMAGDVVGPTASVRLVTVWAADKLITLRPAVQVVQGLGPALTPTEDVLARPSEEAVQPRTSHEGVVARVATDSVFARTAVDSVAAVLTFEAVLPPPPVQEVVAPIAAQKVAFGGSLDVVGSRVALQRPAAGFTAPDTGRPLAAGDVGHSGAGLSLPRRAARPPRL